MSIKHQTIISAVCSIAMTAAWADPTPVKLDHNNLRFTYESVTLPENEAMGLTGLNYQQMFGSYWYGGLGVYGAVAGERGGFFTGGFEGGLRYPLIGDLEVQSGVFVGGGGGGSAPQGGGLMIRSHIGMTYGNDTIRGGLQLSRIEFPNGDIHSTQVSGVVDIPFESFRLDGNYRGRLDTLPFDISDIFQRSMAIRQGEFGVEVQHYIPSSNARKTDGTLLIESFDTIGIQYINFVSRNIAWRVTTAGAMGGGADGYAEVFAGMKWRYGVFDKLLLNLDGAIGMGGGGQIDTGGGAMSKVSAGVSYQLNPAWSVDAGGGYVRAFEGDFSGRTLSCSLNHSFMSFIPSMDRSGKNVYGERLIRQDWRVRPMLETYTSAQRKSTETKDISLAGMQMDVLSSDAGYLYAKALGAYSGGAGGYASGTLGLGINYPLPRKIPVELYVQGGVGAGGGGGIDVGNGAIVEAEAGIRYGFASDTDFVFGAGITQSVSGRLETPTLQFGVAYRFGTLGQK